MLSVEDLKRYVKASDKDDEFVRSCLDAATDMISSHIGTASVPEEVRDQAILQTAANLFLRRTGRRDVTGFTTPDAMPLTQRPALDPLTPARPLLKPYLGVGIA